MQENINQAFNWLDSVGQMGLQYAPRIIGAIFVYLVGRWLIHWTIKVFTSVTTKRKIDPSLRTFFISSIRIGLFALLLLAIIGLVGIPIAGFAAIIAGLAFGIGTALNGSLGNVAGGILILLTRPFEIGDLIKAQHEFGIVQEIGIIHTTILTSQNRTIHLPNGGLSTGVITNFTKQDNLRIDLTIHVKHNTDLDQARDIAISAMRTHPLVLDTPAPDIKVKEITDNGVTLVFRPRIKIKPYDHKAPRQREADYYSVFFGVREIVKKAFQEHGIEQPTAQFLVAVDK